MDARDFTVRVHSTVTREPGLRSLISFNKSLRSLRAESPSADFAFLLVGKIQIDFSNEDDAGCRNFRGLEDTFEQRLCVFSARFGARDSIR